VVVTRADRSDVPTLISIVNATIIFIKPSFSKKASSATKMAEIMALNKPIVTNAGWGDVESIMQNYSNGFIVNPFSIDNNIIDDLLNITPSQVRPKLTEFSLEHGISEYEQIYQTLTA
jgi:hypothetical protein